MSATIDQKAPLSPNDPAYYAPRVPRDADPARLPRLGETPSYRPPATSITTNDPSPPSRSTVPFIPFPFGTPLQATVRISVSGSQRYDTLGSFPVSGSIRASKCMQFCAFLRESRSRNIAALWSDASFFQLRD